MQVAVGMCATGMNNGWSLGDIRRLYRHSYCINLCIALRIAKDGVRFSAIGVPLWFFTLTDLSPPRHQTTPYELTQPGRWVISTSISRSSPPAMTGRWYHKSVHRSQGHLSRFFTQELNPFSPKLCVLTPEIFCLHLFEKCGQQYQAATLSRFTTV